MLDVGPPCGIGGNNCTDSSSCFGCRRCKFAEAQAVAQEDVEKAQQSRGTIFSCCQPISQQLTLSHNPPDCHHIEL